MRIMIATVPMVLLLASAPFIPCQVPGPRIIDMTYAYGQDTIYWPTAREFRLDKLGWGVTKGGWWYASNEYGASEHGGTHADAPIHFAAKGRRMDEVPIEEWIGPAVRIDVTEACAGDRDYCLTPADIKGWEKRHGRVPEGAWVIMYTGIGTKYYPDKKKVLGTDQRGDAALPELSFPGFSPESVEFLISQRDIKGIALDTPSIDAGKRTDFKVHQVLCAAGKLALENIANLDKLPAAGATLYVIPMLIKDGTGSPARVFAVIR